MCHVDSQAREYHVTSEIDGFGHVRLAIKSLCEIGCKWHWAQFGDVNGWGAGVPCYVWDWWFSSVRLAIKSICEVWRHGTLVALCPLFCVPMRLTKPVGLMLLRKQKKTWCATCERDFHILCCSITNVCISRDMHHTSRVVSAAYHQACNHILYGCVEFAIQILVGTTEHSLY